MNDDTANNDAFWLFIIPAVCLVVIGITLYFVFYKKRNHAQLLVRAHYNVSAENVTFATTSKTKSAIPLSSVWGLNLLHIIPVVLLISDGNHTVFCLS